GSQLVEASVRVAVGTRLGEDGLGALLGALDHSQFLSSDGKVDAEKVTTVVNALIPPAPASTPPPTGTPAAPAQGQPQPGALPGQPAAPPGGPDFGQGHPTSAPLNAMEAGRA